MSFQTKTLIALTVLLAFGLTVRAGEIHPELQDWMDGASAADERDVIVQMERNRKGRFLKLKSRAPQKLMAHKRLKRHFSQNSREFRSLGMKSMSVTPARLRRLAADPHVLAVSPDSTVRLMGPPAHSLLQEVAGSSQAHGTFGVTGAGVGIAVLDSGGLVEAGGILFAERGLFAQGVIFAERGPKGFAPDLNFAGQSALGDENDFAQGILFAERELRGLFSSTNDVLVSGEAFIYY